MTGFFTAEEFAKLTGAPVANELVGDEDDAPELPQVATTRDSDLYVMTSHRLLCGDATKEGAYQCLMDSYQADLVVTDPPYNIDYTDKTKKALRIQNDSKTDEDFFAFILAG
jgi:16S rRNA G966 N2-methylase RsmD